MKARLVRSTVHHKIGLLVEEGCREPFMGCGFVPLCKQSIAPPRYEGLTSRLECMQSCRIKAYDEVLTKALGERW